MVYNPPVVNTPPSDRQTGAPAPPPRKPASSSLTRFWHRITEGLELEDLWRQFGAEARAGYGLYSAEVDWEAVNKQVGWRRPVAAARALGWAILMKLSPARRVLFLVALVLFLVGQLGFQFGSTEVSIVGLRGWAFLLLFVLLVLELADRVTMKRDLEIAREIQRWLVPEAPPAVSGLDIDFATRPANTVAGDYYDAFFRDDDRRKLLLVVADVAGKSVPAALLMATFQACLHACAASCDSLTVLVENVNRFSCRRSLGGQRFTTAFLAELDPQTWTLAYVNAGHNAPVLRRVSGMLERLERGGVPFGIDADSRYECPTIQIEKGDLLLIFTDGLIETLNERGEEFGEGRLVSTLDAVPGASAGETLRHVMAAADRFAGATRQHDDVSCLVVRVL